MAAAAILWPQKDDYFPKPEDEVKRTLQGNNVYLARSLQLSPSVNHKTLHDKLTTTKSIMISKKLIIPFLAFGTAAVLNSCLEDNSSDETFSLNVQGYIIQEHTVVELEESTDGTETSVTEEGETKKTKDVYTYKPYFAISSSSVNYPIMSMNVYSSNGSVAMDSCSLYVRSSNLEKNATTSLSKINGTYTATATAAKVDGSNGITSTTGLLATNAATQTFTVAISDTIGDIKNAELSYNGSTISAKLGIVNKAAAYGITLIPYNKGTEPKRISTYYKVASNPVINKTDNTVTYSITFNRTDLADDYAQVKIYCTSSSGLFVESDETLTIEKN